jgi:hypothetical protein
VNQFFVRERVFYLSCFDLASNLVCLASLSYLPAACDGRLALRSKLILLRRFSACFAWFAAPCCSSRLSLFGIAR